MHPFGGMEGGSKTISGGQIMAWMDLCAGKENFDFLLFFFLTLFAGIAAKRHCRRSVVTASFDELHFGVGAKVIFIIFFPIFFSKL